MRWYLYLPGCSGPLKPVVVDATEYSSQFPANSVLVLGERDETVSIQKYNFWLAQSKLIHPTQPQQDRQVHK